MKFEAPNRPNPEISVVVDGVRYENIPYTEMSVKSNTDGTGVVELGGCDTTLLPLRGYLRCEIEIVSADLGIVERHTGMLCYPTDKGYHFRTIWKREPHQI